MKRDELEAYIRSTKPEPEATINYIYGMDLHAKPDCEREGKNNKTIPSVYGVTMPAEWRVALINIAEAKGVGLHALLPQELEKLKSRDEMIDMANDQGVTLTEIKRRLMVKAFPCLPQWEWEVKHAVRATPKKGQPTIKQRNAVIRSKPDTYIEMVLPPDVYAVIKAQAHLRAELPNELAKRIIVAYAKKHMEVKEEQ